MWWSTVKTTSPSEDLQTMGFFWPTCFSNLVSSSRFSFLIADLMALALSGWLSIKSTEGSSEIQIDNQPIHVFSVSLNVSLNDNHQMLINISYQTRLCNNINQIFDTYQSNLNEIQYNVCGKRTCIFLVHRVFWCILFRMIDLDFFSLNRKHILVVQRNQFLEKMK